ITPIFYLDSVPVEMEYTYLDVNNIERVEVIKDAVTGKVYMTSKNTKSFNFLSYSILKNTYFNEINKPVLLLVNGNFIKNPLKINIDSSYIYKVEVECGVDFEELKNLYPNLAIVNIKINNLNNKIGERPIFLQGMPLNNFPE
ncbi:MAG: hypothetical protein LH615_08020, partial [Ferruginibacter sp.]|nr:hypothetical protein [Ferruginibacter sp.]